MEKEIKETKKKNRLMNKENKKKNTADDAPIQKLQSSIQIQRPSTKRKEKNQKHNNEKSERERQIDTSGWMDG